MFKEFTKRRFITLLSLCIILACSIFGLIACGDPSASTPPTSVPHTITFEVEGEIYHSIETKGNETLVLPENPKKSKYTFGGWFFDNETFANEFTAESYADKALPANTTVYAQFIINTENTEEGIFIISSDASYYSYKAPNSIKTSTFTIPGTHNGKPVLELAESAFAQTSTPTGTKLTDIILPEGLVKIGKRAFINRYWIKELKIPNTVEILGEKAFERCSSLETITLPDNLKEVGENIFIDCTKLQTINIGKNLFNLDGTVFGGCESLTTINVSPENPYLTVTNDKALYNSDLTTLISLPAASGTTSIILPESVTSISAKAFYKNTNISSITFNNKLESIGDNAFDGSSITKAILPDNLKTIGISAFNNCSSLKEVYIGKNVNEIKMNTFSNCVNMTELEFYNGNDAKLTNIAFEAFFECKKLTEVVIPNSVETIQAKAFHNCLGLQKLTLGYNLKMFYGGLETVMIEGIPTQYGVGAFTVDHNYVQQTRGLLSILFTRQEGNWSMTTGNTPSPQRRIFHFDRLNYGKYITGVQTGVESSPCFQLTESIAVGNCLRNNPFNWLYLAPGEYEFTEPDTPENNYDPSNIQTVYCDIKKAEVKTWSRVSNS